eukprot:Em0119g1a
MHGGREQLHEVQDTTSTDLISLEPHTEYTIRVRAKTVHFGDYCTPITIHTLKTEIPSPPIGLNVDSVKSTSISISWQPPYDAKCIIREYQVSYTMHGGSEQLREVQDTTSTDLISLEPHTEYTIRVRAKTVHFGDYCTPITIHTLETEIPSPPIGLKVDSVNSTSISISWQPPYDAKCITREYQVSYTMHGGSEQLHEVQDTTSTDLISLEPHTEYTIRVRAKTVHFGDYCTPITIHTLETVLVFKLTDDLEALHPVQYQPESQREGQKELKVSHKQKQGVPTVKLLTDLSILVDGMKKYVSIILRTSNCYTKLAMYLLNDDNCDIVDSLKEKCRGDPVEIVTAVYKKWINGAGRQPVTWQTLLDVLREIEQNSLAEDIETVLKVKK